MILKHTRLTLHATPRRDFHAGKNVCNAYCVYIFFQDENLFTSARARTIADPEKNPVRLFASSRLASDLQQGLTKLTKHRPLVSLHTRKSPEEADNALIVSVFYKPFRVLRGAFKR